MEENFLKQTHTQRHEAAQTRPEEKKRAEKERIMNEEDPERQRRLEVSHTAGSSCLNPRGQECKALFVLPGLQLVTFACLCFVSQEAAQRREQKKIEKKQMKMKQIKVKAM